MNTPTLKPCPACNSRALQLNWYVQCESGDCMLTGPKDDARGAKWNALPRCDDKPQDDRRKELLMVATHLMAGDWVGPDGGGTKIPFIVKAARELVAAIDGKEVAK